MDTLVLVCGGLHSKDIEEARQMVYDGVAALIPYARKRGVQLGIEPLHPMYAACPNVIVTLGQANDFALSLNAEADSDTVGVVIDTLHAMVGPQVYEEIDRAAPFTPGFHACDWLTPLPNVLKGRGMMGDGWCDLPALYSAVAQAGYRGPVECEIFNETIWNSSGDEGLARMKASYLEHVVQETTEPP